MIIKICGITNEGDAAKAVDLGAQWIGLNFYSGSPRCVDPQKAAVIRQNCDARVAGVFVNETSENIRRIAESCRLDAVQLHGDESPELEDQLEGITVIKVFRVDAAFDFSQLERTRARWILLDHRVDGLYGGTGRSFNWSLANGLGQRIWLSGGLNPENVAAAVQTVAPAGLDVCSGVESAPGVKDVEKMRRFIENARRQLFTTPRSTE